MRLITQHLLNNNGDESTSKMMWVAIAFVIGAILLLLTTTAFQEPVQTWYNNVIAEWFADGNGEYTHDKWGMYTKNANGTYKDLQYVMKAEDGTYLVLIGQDSIVSGSLIPAQEYNADGSPNGMPTVIQSRNVNISEDGKTIIVDRWTFSAQLP